MRLDGALREDEVLGDLSVRPASGDKASDLDLAAREPAGLLLAGSRRPRAH